MGITCQLPLVWAVIAFLYSSTYRVLLHKHIVSARGPEWDQTKLCINLLRLTFLCGAVLGICILY